jgi:hypothetical protein
MSRTNRTALRGPLAAVAIAAALAAPADSHAQVAAGERALLNPSVALSGAVAARALRLALVYRGPAESVDGARALLATIATPDAPGLVLTDFPAPARVGGDLALLGVWAREPRRAAP